MSHDQTVAILKYCLGVIRAHLADERYRSQRWFWQLREKVALYALRSQLKDLSDLNVPPLGKEQQEITLKSHPLLAPYCQMPAPVAGPEQRSLQLGMRQKLSRSYLVGPSERRPPSAG